MTKDVELVWLRRDLRLHDNPALYHAAQRGHVLPLFIAGPNGFSEMEGSASCWWLHQSLKQMDGTLGGQLALDQGDPLSLIPRWVADNGITRVSWNRVWEPKALQQEQQLQQLLQAQGITVSIHNGALLWEPNNVLKSDGSPYRVFTPYYRRGCLAAEPPRFPLPKPDLLQIVAPVTPGKSLSELKLLPSIDWYQGLTTRWQPGEAGAQQRLALFVGEHLDHYKAERDRPDLSTTSGLSPHLHFGEISPHQIWHRVQQQLAEQGDSEHADCFLSELAWREFSNYLLYHWPTLPVKNFRAEFDHFPWRSDPRQLECWQQGKTGIPLVDAGMRELWQTGFMHNRVRMVCASFLVKNLLQDWRQGAEWFADTLVDADLASNSASWQWVAGSGADAAPYFRIFNPITQGEKFDPQGGYVRRYCPELAKLPNRWIHAPWQAPETVLAAAEIQLGKDYPEPLVDLAVTRKAALAAYQQMKEQGVSRQSDQA